MRFRAPASIELARAQLFLIMAALVPASFGTIAAILVLVFANRATDVALGILLVVFGVLSIVGAVLVQVFLRRGSALARLQNDFVSTVSHELRTPLTSIRLFVETLAMGRIQDEGEQKRVLTMLAAEVSRLDGLVERVLDLARLEAGKRAFDKAPVRVVDIVDGALAAFETMRLASGWLSPLIEKRVPPELVVSVDRAALEQALLNLLINAYKYTGADKRIEITASDTGRRIELSVKDNGPGITRQDQRVIFDRFERGSDPERNEAQGTGMGLAVVNLIVKAHRGKVEVDSEPGRGATFRMLLRRPKA
jgi:two-component system phosphate regulon sensor histidine kinase PhoR